MQRSHGGDWAAFLNEYGKAPLDFSANVSPLGVPEGVRAAVFRAAARSDRYPDPGCRALCASLATREGVSRDWVLCGNGASELIWRAVHALRPKRALVTSPCFGEYEAALEAFGCEVSRFRLEVPFIVSDDILKRITPGLELLILCNPNNPTGRTIDQALLSKIVRRCESNGTRLLLDECFVDFLNEPELHTAKDLLASCPSLLILKAFTKLFGMAGLRLGYVLCADVGFLNAMRRAGPPWSVSLIAQEAGLAALEDEEYVARLRALIQTERPRLLRDLQALGLRVIPGEANFLLFQCCTPLLAPLRQRGILIRGCADFRGLDESWYRVAVRTETENARLIEALKEILT